MLPEREAFCGAMKHLPLAPEVVGLTPEKNKEVEVVTEAPIPPVLKFLQVAVKKIKTKQLQVPPGEVQPPSQVMEHTTF